MSVDSSSRLQFSFSRVLIFSSYVSFICWREVSVIDISSSCKFSLTVSLILSVVFSEFNSSISFSRRKMFFSFTLTSSWVLLLCSSHTSNTVCNLSRALALEFVSAIWSSHCFFRSRISDFNFSIVELSSVSTPFEFSRESICLWSSSIILYLDITSSFIVWISSDFISKSDSRPSMFSFLTFKSWPNFSISVTFWLIESSCAKRLCFKELTSSTYSFIFMSISWVNSTVLLSRVFCSSVNFTCCSSKDTSDASSFNSASSSLWFMISLELFISWLDFNDASNFCFSSLISIDWLSIVSSSSWIFFSKSLLLSSTEIFSTLLCSNRLFNSCFCCSNPCWRSSICLFLSSISCSREFLSSIRMVKSFSSSSILCFMSISFVCSSLSSRIFLSSVSSDSFLLMTFSKLTIVSFAFTSSLSFRSTSLSW